MSMLSNVHIWSEKSYSYFVREKAMQVTLLLTATVGDFWPRYREVGHKKCCCPHAKQRTFFAKVLHDHVEESIHFSCCKKHIQIDASFPVYREAEALFSFLITGIAVCITGTGLPQGKLFPFLQLCLRLCCRRMRISWACFSLVLEGRLWRLYDGACNKKHTLLVSLCTCDVNKEKLCRPKIAWPRAHYQLDKSLFCTVSKKAASH